MLSLQEHKFDDILDFLCKDIMSKTEKQNVRDEIYDHLMCKYETNLAIGLDNEKAEEKAIEELGDISLLRFKLGQVHSYAPKPSLKKAMNLFIFGFILCSFQISFFNGMKEIIMFVGSVALFVAVFCLRTANKKLALSFYLEAIIFVIRTVCIAISSINFNGFNITVPFQIVINLIETAFWLLTIYGLYELVKPYMKEETDKLKPSALGLGNFAILQVVTHIVIIFLNIVYFIDGDLYEERMSRSFILFGSVIGSGLYTLPRVSKLLWNSDHEYKIEDSPSKKIIASVIAVLIAVAPTIAVDFALANQKSVTSVHTIDDIEMSQEEYKRICNNLLSYDIPENIVYNLPKSEIMKYSDSINKYEYDDEILKYLEQTTYQNKKEICNDVDALFSVCAIGMTGSDNYPYVRVISWLEYNSSGKGYDDALFWDYDQRNLVPLNFNDKYEGDLLLILSFENDKILRNEPLDIYTNNKAHTNRMTGVRFQSKKDMTVIHAETFGLGVRNAVTNQNYCIDFIHRISPFTFFCRSPLYVEENGVHNKYLGYTAFYEMSMISWANVYNDDVQEENQ